MGIPHCLQNIYSHSTSYRIKPLPSSNSLNLPMFTMRYRSWSCLCALLTLLRTTDATIPDESMHLLRVTEAKRMRYLHMKNYHGTYKLDDSLLAPDAVVEGLN